MQRIIKFRAYDKTLERFLTEDEANIYTLEALGVANSSIVFTQLTGLRDSNDCPIYEGDLLLAYNEKWKVIFSEASFIAIQANSIHQKGKPLGYYKPLKSMYCEVIGNVFEGIKK